MAICARRWAWGVAGAAWLLAVTTGFVVVWRHAAAPGTESHAPTRWPERSGLVRATDRATLVMFVHPRCSCSRASLTELGHMLQRVRGRVTPEVVFIRPRGVEPGWENSELRQLAARLPEVVIVDDDGGSEAARFGASTSGATLLYDAGARLIFSGGITAVRGHEGDSFGEERMVALLSGNRTDRPDSPVFGCPLDDAPALKETQR